MEGFKQIQGWENYYLDDICSSIVRGPFGGALKKEFFVDFGYKVYEQKNAIYQRSDIGSYYIDENKFRELKRFIVETGDFIVSCSGTIGCIYQIPVNSPKGIINQALLKLKVNQRICSPNLFYYIFKSKAFQEKIIDSTQGGAMKNLIGMSLFKKMPFFIPASLPEQEAIAKALSDVDSLIDTLERKIAKKRNIKQGAMQRLLTGKQQLPGFSGDWVEKKLGEIALMQSGGTPKSDNPHYYNGNIPWLVINDMTVQGKFLNSTEKKISKIGLDNSSARIFKRGTVMYAMYASLGKCSIADIDLSCNQAILGITVSDQLSNSFLYYYLCSIEEDVKNMGQTGTQSNLSKEIVQNFIIKLPSLKEQTAIAQILADMDNEIATLEQKLDKYKQIKQGMMQELLTGKIRLI